MEDALAECYTYNQIGGLDDQTIADIAHDHDISFDALRGAFYGDAPVAQSEQDRLLPSDFDS